MNPERIADQLLSAGVLDEADDGAFVLSDTFRDTRSQLLNEIEETVDVSSELETVTGGSVRVPDDRQEQRSMLATYRALEDLDGGLSRKRRLQIIPLIDRFTDPPTRSDGAPDGFTSVSGSQLKSLIRTSRRAIVYVWRDDCEPCDVMKAEFEDLFHDHPIDIALLAIYGPKYPSLLREYDVGGAPTTLFIREGTVDARLHGAHYRDMIEREIEILREQS